MVEPIAGPLRTYLHPDYLDEAAHANIREPADATLDLCSIDDERGLVTTAEILRPLFARWAAQPGLVLPYPVADHHWQATLGRLVLDAFGGQHLGTEAIYFGDGTYEIFKELAGFVLRKGTLLGAGPVYPEFAGYFTAAGGRFRAVNDERGGFPAEEVQRELETNRDVVAVYADLPYNATGGWPAREDVIAVIEAAARRDVLVIIDEAYANFLGRDHTYIPDVARHDNLLVLRSLSKGFDLRGLRFGWVVAGARVAPLLRHVRSPYAPSQPAAQAAACVLRDAPDIVRPLTAAIRAAKARVLDCAAQAGMIVRPTHPAAPNTMLRSPTPGLAARLAALRVRVAQGSQFGFTAGTLLDDDVRLRVPLLPARQDALSAALLRAR